ncbi:HAD-IB family hydrolase [Corynebacterium sp. SCR221107]|uniref:HAD family hydrolase n=1 Tax=Corynebacterium sp. SCR221107 TaxID=3017361 RepID=UPI0022EC2571|nr:HAD family hydrolase [Corynebacterium sp. SCR221107]WBT09042.1 HAD-IB family hydrolase [Corynebacterium sp. SCR221107]
MSKKERDHEHVAPAPSNELALAPRRVAAFFDLDKTIIATSSAFAYGKEFLNSGLITPVEALQLSMAKATYMFAGHSSEQMDTTRDQLAHMIAGWNVEQVKAIAEETMQHVVTPTIYAEARSIIDQHLAAGHDVVIISASARELVEPIAKELGVTTVVSTELAKKDGVFTGEITFYCKGAAKAQAIMDLTARRGYDLPQSFAYSDSAVDIPMLEAVGNPNAVNPDRALRKVAADKGWNIHSFRNPVPLFQMPTGVEIGKTTGVVAAIAAAAAGGIWLAKKHRPDEA